MAAKALSVFVAGSLPGLAGALVPSGTPGAPGSAGSAGSAGSSGSSGAPWWLPICGVAIAAEALALLAWTAVATWRAAPCKRRGPHPVPPLPSSPGGGKGGGHLVVVNAEPCFPRGLSSKSNAAKACPFDSGLCYGCWVVLHRPTDEPERFASGQYPYADHMHGRRRFWEFRLQLTCREAIDGDVFFGCEQDRYYKIGAVEGMVSNSVISLLRNAAADGMYQTHGEDPTTTKDEAERPGIVFPLWVMDQIVITPQGEEPPDLCSKAFPTLGYTKAADRKAYRKVIDAIEFKPGCTYSFGFWCIAQYVDAIGWCVPQRGIVPRIRLGDVGTHPPCYITMYALQPRHRWPSKRGGRDRRHLDSRKRYMWRVAFWSSQLPPEPRRQRELVAPEPEPEAGVGGSGAHAARPERPGVLGRCCCGGG